MNPSYVPVLYHTYHIVPYVQYSVDVPAKGCSGAGNLALGEGISNSRVGGVGNRPHSKSLYTY